VRRIKPSFSLETAGDSDDGLLGVLVDGADGAFDRLSAGETMTGLKDCVEALGGDDKYFLEMHINRGVRLDDMREHLGISRSAVDVYKSRLMGRLRDCFKRKGFLAG
jgi:hypothetical protein